MIDHKNSIRELLQLIDTFNIVTGCKNYSKISSHLYINDKETEEEIRETSPFIIAKNNKKYLDVTQTKQVKDLFEL